MEIEINVLKKKIDDYFLGNISKEDSKECINILKMTEDKPGTIQSVLDNYIRSFLKRNIDDFEENCLGKSLYMGLYVSKKKNKCDVINKVIKYLECYIGMRSFDVDILFISGDSQIILNI